MLVVAERDVELGDRFAGQQPPQIGDQGVGGPEVDVEVGAGEAEEDADVLDVGQDGVHDNPRLGVEQREHERRRCLDRAEPAHQVGQPAQRAVLAAVEV